MPNNIRSERVRLGLNQTQLGERIGVSVTTVRDWENENRKPASDKVVEMAHLFGCTIDYLLALTDERT